MKKSFELLQILTTALKPSDGRRHSLTLADDGSATLILALSANGGFYKFNLDEDDFEEPADTLADEVLDLFRQAVREESVKPAG